MRTQTHAANTNTWLEATSEGEIRAYVVNYTPTLSIRESPFPVSDLGRELSQVSVFWFPDLSSVFAGPQIDLELEAWDILSNEALETFERDLE